jgi:hypothetical protein
MRMERFEDEFEHSAVRLVAKAFKKKFGVEEEVLYYEDEPFLARARYDNDSGCVIYEEFWGVDSLSKYDPNRSVPDESIKVHREHIYEEVSL